MINQISGLTAVASLLLTLNAQAAVQLVPSSASVNVNDSFTVNVSASALTNIDSASVKFTYDQALVRLDAITLDGAAFCDIVIRDSVADDGSVEGIFALAHQPAGDPCPALSGNFVAFQIQMTALAAGNASLAMTQNATGFGWTSEDNPGVVVAAADTTASPLAIAIDTDSDGDGVGDSVDNCTQHANPNQIDADSNGVGNRCDADFGGTANFVDATDITVFTNNFVFNATTGDMRLDINENGILDAPDATLLTDLFNKPIGPSCCGPQ